MKQNHQIFQGRPRSLAAEALVLGLLKSSVGDNPDIVIQISNLAQDKAGYDFTLHDKRSLIHIDVTTSNNFQNLARKLKRQNITTFLVPFRGSGNISKDHVEITQEIFDSYYYSTPAKNGLINALTAQEKLQQLMEVNVYMMQDLVDQGYCDPTVSQRLEDLYYWLRDRKCFELYESSL